MLTIESNDYEVVSGGQIRHKGVVRNYTKAEIAANLNGVAEYLVKLPKQSFLVPLKKASATKTEKSK